MNSELLKELSNADSVASVEDEEDRFSIEN